VIDTVDCDQVNLNPDEDGSERKQLGKSIRKSSPWLTYFRSIVEGVNKDSKWDGIVQVEEINPYFSSGLIKYLLEHWLSLFPIWCMAVLPIV